MTEYRDTEKLHLLIQINFYNVLHAKVKLKFKIKEVTCLQTTKCGPACRSAATTVMTHSPVCDCRAG